MSPEERQLLAELFERVRSQANAPRDRDAENFIADGVRAQPYAPYLLAQAVLIQEQALKGADQKIRELEARLAQPQPAPQSGGSFLGGLFGGGAAQPAPAPQPPQQASPWGQAAAPQPAYAPPPPAAPSPWGGAPQASAGGGFLRNAMGAAAGVAGGVLLANSLRGLFGGHGGGGFGGGAGLLGGGGAPVVNNYYEAPQDSGASAQDADYDDDNSSGGDDYSDGA